MFIDHFISCVYFFQWICTKIGCAAERPRGIWICSTWSKMYVFLQNILKWEESETLNTNISCQNICTYYVQRKLSQCSKILSSIFFFSTNLHSGVTWCNSPRFTRSHGLFFFLVWKWYSELNKKKMWNFLSPLYPCRKSLAISQGLKWISDAVFW